MTNMSSNRISKEVINDFINQPILRMNHNKLIPVIVYQSTSDGKLPKNFQKLFPSENGSPTLQRGIRIDPIDCPTLIPKYIYPLGKIDSHSLFTPEGRRKRVKVKARLYPLSPSKYYKENRFLSSPPTRNRLKRTQIRSKMFSSSPIFSVEGVDSVWEDNTNSYTSVNDLQQSTPEKVNTDVHENLAVTNEAYRDAKIQMSGLSSSSTNILEKKVDSDLLYDSHVSARFSSCNINSGTTTVPGMKHTSSGSVNHLTDAIKIKAKSSSRCFTKNKRKDMFFIREADIHNVSSISWPNTIAEDRSQKLEAVTSDFEISCLEENSLMSESETPEKVSSISWPNTIAEDRSQKLEAVTSDFEISCLEENSLMSESETPEKVHMSSHERLRFDKEITCTQLNSHSDESVSSGYETKGRLKSYFKIASKDEFWAKKFKKLSDSGCPEKVQKSSLERLKFWGKENACPQLNSNSNKSIGSGKETKGRFKSYSKIASKDKFWAKTLSRSYSQNINSSASSEIEKDQINETTRSANTPQPTICDSSCNKSSRLTLLIKKGKNSEYICSISEKPNLCCESEKSAPTSEKQTEPGFDFVQKFHNSLDLQNLVEEPNDYLYDKMVDVSKEKRPIEDTVKDINYLETSCSVEEGKHPLSGSDCDQELQSCTSMQNSVEANASFCDLDSSNTEEPIRNICNKTPDFTQMDMDAQMNTATQLVTLNGSESLSLSKPPSDSLICSVSHTHSKMKLRDVEVTLQRNTPLEYFITNDVDNMTYQDFLDGYNLSKGKSIKEEDDFNSWTSNDFVPLKEEMFYSTTDEDDYSMDIKMEPIDPGYPSEFLNIPINEEKSVCKDQKSDSGDIFGSGDESVSSEFEGFENTSKSQPVDSSTKSEPLRCSNRLKNISGLANKSPLEPQQVLKTPQRSSEAKNNRCEDTKSRQNVQNDEPSRKLRKRNENTISMESKVNSKIKDVQNLFECKKYLLHSFSPKKLLESECPKNGIKESSRNKCCFCNFTTNVQSVLDRHLMSHRVSSNWCCTFCSYVTPFKTYLRAHAKSHIGQELFQCSECSYRCRRKRDLQTHTRKHNRAKYLFRSRKPYKCKICSFSGSAFDEMVSHVLEHLISKF